MGEPVTAKDIPYLLDARIELSCPYFVSDPERIEGIVRYVEASGFPTKVMLEQIGVGYLIPVDFNCYQKIERLDDAN